MRPILFVFADSQCATTVRGVLDDENRRHHRLGCAPFDFDPTLDVLQHPGHDPGLYDQGAKLLQKQMQKQPFERVVIVLDEAWGGSPGKVKIEAKIHADVVATLKCDPANVAVICIQPELEAWIWQDHPVVDAAFRFKAGSLRQWLADAAELRGKTVVKADPLKNLLPLWPIGQPKPTDPKRAVEVTRAVFRSPPASVIFSEITSQATLSRCTDPAFLKLRQALQNWFPKPLLPSPAIASYP